MFPVLAKTFPRVSAPSIRCLSDPSMLPVTARASARTAGTFQRVARTWRKSRYAAALERFSRERPEPSAILYGEETAQRPEEPLDFREASLQLPLPSSRRRSLLRSARRKRAGTSCCRRRGRGGSGSRGRRGPEAASRERTPGRGPRGAPLGDPVFTEGLRKGRREIQGRIDDGDVSRPGSPRTDGSGGVHPRAPRTPGDPHVRAPPAERRHLADDRHQERLRRVEPEAGPPAGTDSARNPDENDVVVVRESRDGSLVPVLLLGGRPVRVRLLVVEEGRVQEKAVPDRPDATRRQSGGPGTKDGPRIILVKAPGDRRIAPSVDDEKGGPPASRRPGPPRPEGETSGTCTPAEPVESGRGREELRRRCQDQVGVGVRREDGGLPDGGDRHADLRAIADRPAAGDRGEPFGQGQLPYRPDGLRLPVGRRRLRRRGRGREAERGQRRQSGRCDPESSPFRPFHRHRNDCTGRHP